MVSPLSNDELAAALASLPSWSVDAGHLVREVSVPADEAGELVERVGAAADAMDHHPVVDVSDDSVRFAVWSHSLDALTSNDVELATRIDEIVLDSRGG